MAEQLTIQRGYYRTRDGHVAWVDEQRTYDNETFWFGTIAAVGLTTWRLDGCDASNESNLDLAMAITKQEYDQGYNEAWRKEQNP